MEVNSLLCVGRSRLSQFGKTHLSNSGFSTPERTTLEDMSNTEGLSETDLVARVSSKLSSRSLSPPATKSILRGKVLSPKQGSPSSLRSVRFSDKETEDDIMYAKIHVNKNVQTEHIHKNKTHKETQGGSVFKLDFSEKQTEQPDNHEIKTSTPRYSKHEETPSLDFHTPRDRHEDLKQPYTASKVVESQSRFSQEKSCPSNPQERSYPEHKHERIIIDIDIDRKRPAEYKTRQDEKSESALTKYYKKESNVKRKPAVTSDGNKIIQNMDLNMSARSKSPERRHQEIPDGKKIIQNMDLNHSDIVTRVISTASQTSSSDTSSPRSASPETPCQNLDTPDGRQIIKNMELKHLDSSLMAKSKSVQTKVIPDGKKITQNLELSSRDSSLHKQSKPSQSVTIPDGRKITQNMDLTFVHGTPKNTSVEVQTLNPEDLIEERFRSVPIQTELNISEDVSPEDSLDNSKSRSIAIQATPQNEPNIPDGSKITRNMETHKPEKTKHYNDSSKDKKRLNDSNWNEFVRHLELFNPSSSSNSSVSVSEDEPQRDHNSEPVLVYDRNAHPHEIKNSGVTTEQPAKSQRLSERSARTFLESDDFTKHQVHEVLREEGFLSKYKSGLKSTENSPTSAKSAMDNYQKDTNLSKPNIYAAKPNGGSPAFVKQKTEHFRVNNQYVNQPERKTVSTHPKEAEVFAKLRTETDPFIQLGKKQKKAEKDHLGFTPIETYSFNPETLIKATANRAYCTATPAVVQTKTEISHPSNAITNMTPKLENTESISKNSFVQGLDLGPIPQSTAVQRYSSMLSGASEPKRQAQFRTSTNHHNAHKLSVSDRYRLQDAFTTSSNGSSRSSSLASSSQRPTSMSGYQASVYSHVTGHSHRQLHPPFQTASDHYRPSSAPTPRGKLFSSTPTLSSSLKEMRNTIVRKSTMHQYTDQKRRPTAIDKLFSNKTSSPMLNSSYDQGYTPSKISNDFMRRHETQKDMKPTNDNLMGSSVSRSVYLSRKNSPRSFSPRYESPRRSDYLNALHDKSNARPVLRDRSRSRSRSPSPNARNVYEKIFLDTRPSTRQRENAMRGSSTYIKDEMRKYVETNEDHGDFDSFVSRGNHTKSDLNKAFSSSRESRASARKPPIPSRRKTSRSPSNGRSRSRSADRKAGGNTNISQEMNKENEKNISAKSAKQKLSPDVVKKHNEPDKVCRANEKPEGKNGLGTVTIGDVPQGLVDQECMYLGHDIIQKIIDEAKL